MTRSCASKRRSTRLPQKLESLLANLFWTDRVAAGGGRVVLVALLFGAIAFDPRVMACAAAALLGGFVAWAQFGTADETAAEIAAAEAERAALIGHQLRVMRRR